MGGVNFTEPAAQRISRAVVKSEGIPTPTNTQRQRAGGLGRMSLWQVTAVQTGAGTVTIKRVKNQLPGDLIDASIKINIVRDNLKPASVGDRGLLIRQGNGSLFFFNRDVPSFVTVINEAALVKSDSPDTTFNYNDNVGKAIKLDRNGIDHRAVVKFNTPVEVDPQAGNVRNIMSLGLFISDITFPAITTTSEDRAEFNLQANFIDQDFDASTITFNKLIALTRTTAGMGIHIDADKVGGSNRRASAGPRENIWLGRPDTIATKSPFGVEIFFDKEIVPPSSFWVMTAQLAFAETETFPSGYLGSLRVASI